MLEQLIDLMNRLNVNMLSWLPEAASTYAQAIDEVFYIIYIITGLGVPAGDGADVLVSPPVQGPARPQGRIIRTATWPWS